MTATNINWDNVAKWSAVLRSAKYMQGKGTLYNIISDTYCCLGVLQKEFCGTTNRKLNGRFALFESGMEFLGTVRNNPNVFNRTASFLNDGPPGYIIYSDGDDKAPLTFDEIADLLDIAVMEREGIE